MCAQFGVHYTSIGAYNLRVVLGQPRILQQVSYIQIFWDGKFWTGLKKYSLDQIHINGALEYQLDSIEHRELIYTDTQGKTPA